MYSGDVMKEIFEIDEQLIKLSNEAEEVLAPIFQKYEENSLLWSSRVLKAFQDNWVASSDFVEVTGYGYSDEGRDKLERIYAQIFGAEDALVRPQIMSGTHALALTLFGVLKYGDTMISITGEPYDSLRTVIGTCGDSRNSLIANGIKYEEIALVDNDFDIPAITERLKKSPVKLVENYGLKLSEIKMIESVIEENTEVIAEHWNKFFNNNK